MPLMHPLLFAPPPRSASVELAKMWRTDKFLRRLDVRACPTSVAAPLAAGLRNAFMRGLLG
jgi:hypothetical protein